MLDVIVPSRSASKRTKSSLQIARCKLNGSAGISRHERRVATIAVKLFDLLAPQHGLSSKYRNLLHIAALLHDAGRVCGAKGHEFSGAAMVLADQSLPLMARQRRAVAYLVRYHRGSVPAIISDQQILSSGDRHAKLRILLGILRASDAMDSRHLRPMTIIIKRTARKLRINCLVQEDLAEATRRLGGRGKFELLESKIGLRVRLRIKQAAPAA